MKKEKQKIKKEIVVELSYDEVTKLINQENIENTSNNVYGCSESTENIEIPSNITNIEKDTFWGFDKLSKIVVDKNNPKYDSRDNCNAIIETATNTLVVGCKDTHIPNSVTNIGEYAFSGCRLLEKIEIPNSVTKICKGAFCDCYSLKSITIPSSVLSIEEDAFLGCDSLTNVYYEGSQEKWKEINKNTEKLAIDIIHYNYKK